MHTTVKRGHKKDRRTDHLCQFFFVILAQKWLCFEACWSNLKNSKGQTVLFKMFSTMNEPLCCVFLACRKHKVNFSGRFLARELARHLWDMLAGLILSFVLYIPWFVDKFRTKGSRSHLRVHRLGHVSVSGVTSG